MRTALIAALLTALAVVSNAGSLRAAENKPVVEVAFVIDTTGSMTDLIEGAKAKIWYIAEKMVSGKPTPQVKMALVAFRDKGDEYVTKVFDLTDNIDKVYEDLMGFEAKGGGDTPENVNLALYEAVHKLSWSKDQKALRIIYLVGDSPPHTDYKDVQEYAKTAEEAVRNGIYINTILCGANQDTKKIWLEIADAAEGSFIAVAQSGGVKEVSTPFDDKLSELNRELLGTVVAYGTDDDKESAGELRVKAGLYDAPAGASRAVYSLKSGEVVTGGKDLVEASAEDDSVMEDLDEGELPENMKSMTDEERKKFIEEKKEERDKILKEIEQLSKKRETYIRDELSKSDEKKEGFDEKALDALKKQAEKKGIKYEE